VNLFNFLFLFFVLINSCVLPLLYPKLWFLFITILILLSLVLYRKLVRKEKINNTVFLITFFIAIFNLLITMLGYTTNFLLISIKNKENQKKNLLQIQNNTIIKGKVVVLGSFNEPVANAKISLLQGDVLLDIFFTNVNGEFEYVVSDRINLDNCLSLKIEHPNFEPYETKFLLSRGMAREFEVYLCRKTK